MQRRFLWLILFGLPWLVVLSVPELRLLLRVQTLGSTVMAPQYPWAERLEGDAFDFQRLARLHPSDVQVLGHAIRGGFGGQVNDRGPTRQYDALIRRFPDNLWLMARRIESTFTWFHGDRLAGDFDNSRRIAGVPSPEKTKEPPSFNAAELEQAIAVAERGRRLEPDNAYFDLRLVALLMAGYRDAEAFKVLHEGSLKPRYDNHTRDDGLANLHAHELVRPLLFEEKLNLNSSIMFPQYAKMRELMRLISWQAWKLERVGKHIRALQIRADMARMCAAMMRPPNSSINGAVAAALQSLAWSGNPARKVTPLDRRALGRQDNVTGWTRLRARKFADYATAHGRQDLAQETLRLAEATVRMDQALQPMLIRRDIYNIPAWMLVRTTTLWYFSLAVLGQAGLCLILYVVLSVALWRTRPVPLMTRDRWAGLATGGVLTLICVLDAWRAKIGLHFGLGAIWESDNPEALGNQALAVAILTLLAWSPVLGGWLCCSAVTMRRLNDLSQQVDAATEYDGISARAIPASAGPIVMSFCLWGMALTAGAGWITALLAYADDAGDWEWALPGNPDITISMSDPALSLTLLALMLTLLALLGCIIKWRWLMPARLRPVTHYTLRWYRYTLGGWLIIASFAYLFVLAASLPVRHAAAARLNEYLRKGEIAMLVQGR